MLNFVSPANWLASSLSLLSQVHYNIFWRLLMMLIVSYVNVRFWVVHEVLRVVVVGCSTRIFNWCLLEVLAHLIKSQIRDIAISQFALNLTSRVKIGLLSTQFSCALILIRGVHSRKHLRMMLKLSPLPHLLTLCGCLWLMPYVWQVLYLLTKVPWCLWPKFKWWWVFFHILVATYALVILLLTSVCHPWWHWRYHTIRGHEIIAI